ncbi:Rrp15p [Novymonas esmeraldas]|uniref:Rrp15p n=1 Tax=Novymonas esmeraldas TaxID=1808958 RepID=A0AAW0EWY3_9TRYP
MAGKFRGDVGKLSKQKKSKAGRRAKSKKVVSLVKRSPKLAQDSLQSRIAELTNGDSALRTSIGGAKASKASKAAAPPSSGKVPVGKAALEVVGRQKRERVVPERDAPVQRSTAEAVGLKILHQAVKSQSHGRLLPHQNRHDYEYRLRSVATMGVVQLFNSLAQSRKAGAALDAEEAKMTSDKVVEKKQVVSKEAFLAALRQSQQY